MSGSTASANRLRSNYNNRRDHSGDNQRNGVNSEVRLADISSKGGPVQDRLLSDASFEKLSKGPCDTESLGSRWPFAGIKD